SWWERAGDLARNAEKSLLSAICDEKNLLARRAVKQTLAKLKTELLGPSPTPLERLLVERIATCWLQVQLFENVYATNLHAMSRLDGEYYQRRLDHAHKRYLSAIRSL